MLHDADIREPLFDFLEETYGKIRILEEKVTGMSRADVVMVTEDSLYGLEIKSDADSYTRLSGQVKDYDKYFDFNYAVVGTRHAMHIREHIPEYWGVITVEEVDGELDFYVLQKPSRNPKLRMERKLSFLWRPELARIQEWHNMPKYKDRSKEFVIAKIAERPRLPEDKKGYIARTELDREISDLLLERDYNMVESVMQEYYKGELQKRLEVETDPEKQMALLAEQAEKKAAFKKKRRRRRR